MIIGFTGTRAGMSQKQDELVKEFLRTHVPDAVMHGDCVGADKDFDNISASLGILRYSCPCTLTEQRAFTDAVLWQQPKPPLERNRDIVNVSDVILACPKEMHEIMRSGTWATIRYAKSRKKELHIFYPDGSQS